MVALWQTRVLAQLLLVPLAVHQADALGQTSLDRVKLLRVGLGLAYLPLVALKFNYLPDTCVNVALHTPFGAKARDLVVLLNALCLSVAYQG